MKRYLVIAGVGMLASGAFAQISEDFANVAGLTGAGWNIQNLSDSASTNNYFQGNLTVFDGQGGVGDPYVGTNYQATSGTLGTETISVWLITPIVTIQNGSTFSFYTRTVPTPAFPDRLEVRMNTANSGTNVGATSSSVGDFTNLITTINSGLTTSGYPNTWTQVNYTVIGVGSPVSGRFAFRYFVPNAGPNGNNSDYIGIDTVRYTPVPEPATMAALGLGVAALIRRRRK